MIGLDTNVLVRYLVQDDRAQSRKASELLERASPQVPAFFISDIVLCELVWVLRGAYRLDKAAVVATFERLLMTREFEFQNRTAATSALEEFREGPDDFADYLIGQLGRSAGCEHTATFDRDLRGSRSFRVL